MKRWWMSFWFKDDDYRPLHCPPSWGILGWWCNGYSSNDGNALCILVEAEAEEEAKNLLLRDWPESVNAKWRFCDERPTNWLPSDRFPMPKWSVNRI